MKMFFDIRCEKCGNKWTDYLGTRDAAGDCPACGSFLTHKMPGGLKNYKAASPYDVLDRKGGPDVGKKIFSGPRVHSK